MNNWDLKQTDRPSLNKAGGMLSSNTRDYSSDSNVLEALFALICKNGN